MMVGNEAGWSSWEIEFKIETNVNMALMWIS